MEDVLEPLETTEEQPIIEAAEAEAETPGAEEEPGAPVTSLFDETGRKINPAVKAILGKLKAENPGAEKLLSKAIFRTAELEREFPGGLAEARQLREDVQKLGGLEQVQERLQAAEQFNGLAGAYEKADPAFVQDLVESYPDSFKALGPVFIQQYAQLDPEAYASLIGKAMYADISNSGFLLAFQRLADFVTTDNPKAIETYNALSNYLKEIGVLAAKAPAVGAKPKPATPKDDDSAKRDTDLTRREWDIDRKTMFNGIASKVYKEAIAGKELSAEDKADIEERFQIRVTALTKQLFPDVTKRLESFLARKDQKGYFSYLKTVYDKVVPQAVTAAVNSSLRHKPPVAAKPAVVNKLGQALPAAAKPAAAPAGFKPVSKEPGPYEIDYDKTSKAMVQAGQYVLKSGQKVSVRI